MATHRYSLHSGAASLLVERMLAYDLGGSVAFDPEGVVCTIEAMTNGAR